MESTTWWSWQVQPATDNEGFATKRDSKESHESGPFPNGPPADGKDPQDQPKPLSPKPLNPTP